MAVAAAALSVVGYFGQKDYVKELEKWKASQVPVSAKVSSIDYEERLIPLSGEYHGGFLFGHYNPPSVRMEPTYHMGLVMEGGRKMTLTAIAVDARDNADMVAKQALEAMVIGSSLSFPTGNIVRHPVWGEGSSVKAGRYDGRETWVDSSTTNVTKLASRVSLN